MMPAINLLELSMLQSHIAYTLPIHQSPCNHQVPTIIFFNRIFVESGKLTYCLHLYDFSGCFFTEPDIMLY